jgi:hypothetical protein
MDSPQTKSCRKCGRILPLDAFYHCRTVKDGRKARCKRCMSGDQKERFARPEVRARRRAYSRWWNNSPRGKAYHRAYKQTEQYQEKETARRRASRNISKIKARYAVKDAVKYGRLTKKPCAVCGSEDTRAHHIFGYAPENWTEVVWLCPLHHDKAEARLRQERERQ